MYKTIMRYKYVPCSIAALFFFFFSFSCMSYRSQLENVYFTQADELYKEKKYSQALPLFEKAQALSFTNSAKFRVIEIMILEGSLEKAKRMLNLLLISESKNQLVRELEAFWYFKDGQFQVAREKYTQILGTGITAKGRLYVNLALIYFAEKRIEESLEYFKKALDLREISEEIFPIYLDVLTYTKDAEADNTKIDDVNINGNKNTDLQNIESAQDASSSVEYSQEVIFELNKTISILLEKYEAEKISADQVFVIAKSLLDRNFFIHSFALYKKLSESKLADIYQQTRAYFLLASMLVKKQYESNDAQPLNLFLSYLRKGFENTIPRTTIEQKDYEDILFDILNEESITSVLKTRVVKMYEEYGIDLSKQKEEKLSEQDLSDVSDVNNPDSATTEEPNETFVDPVDAE